MLQKVIHFINFYFIIVYFYHNEKIISVLVTKAPDLNETLDGTLFGNLSSLKPLISDDIPGIILF